MNSPGFVAALLIFLSLSSLNPSTAYAKLAARGAATNSGGGVAADAEHQSDEPSGVISLIVFALKAALASAVGYLAIDAMLRLPRSGAAKRPVEPIDFLCGTDWVYGDQRCEIRVSFNTIEAGVAQVEQRRLGTTDTWTAYMTADRNGHLEGWLTCDDHGLTVTQSFSIKRAPDNTLLFDARFKHGVTQIPRVKLRRRRGPGSPDAANR